MKKSDLLKILEPLKDEEDINNTLLANEEIKGLIKPFNPEELGIDDFKKILASNKEIKGYLTSDKDRAISKAIATYETNTLPKKVEEELRKRNNEGLTEDQIQIKQLKEEMQKMQEEKNINELKGRYTKELEEKGLKSDALKLVFDKDEKNFKENVDLILNLIKNGIDEGVKEQLKKNSYEPPKAGGSTNSKIQWSDVLENPKLAAEYMKQEGSNQI